jgi:hypothetical protein
MFDSQTIQMQGLTSTVLFSPWFPRGGDYGAFTLEVSAVSGGATLAVALISKNTSEPGDGGVPVTILTFQRNVVGRTTVDFANGSGTGPVFGGFKELVRYRFTLSGGAVATTSWATFRMLSPVWYDKV